MEVLKSFSSFTNTLKFNTLFKKYNKPYNQVTRCIVFNVAFTVKIFKGSSDLLYV